jgi:hypothetical protein
MMCLQDCCQDLFATFLYLFKETRLAQKLSKVQMRRMILHDTLPEANFTLVQSVVSEMKPSEYILSQAAKNICAILSENSIKYSKIQGSVQLWANGALDKAIKKHKSDIGEENDGDDDGDENSAFVKQPDKFYAGDELKFKVCPICYDESAFLSVCFPCGHIFCNVCMPIPHFEKCHVCKTPVHGEISKLYG